MALLLARRQRRFSSLIRFFSNSSSNPPPKAANASLQKPSQPPSNSLKDLTTKLAKFQRRSAAPPPKDSVPPPSISFEALYKHKVASSNSSSKALKLGRGEAFPTSVVGKETEEEEMRTEFLKNYREDELGEKLKMLRPEEGKKKEGEWFSLEELNERLAKLRQIEEKENPRVNFSLLRNVIGTLDEDEKPKNDAISLQNLDILGYLDGTPEYKHYPPKDELVETYFHSDNLSSAEKMKIELTKVRDDFKMSESDCGSARVQVAQLTAKIKHLTSALHKKDKHSRKGLVAMVQKRKKLLKYLRRTDWDSYRLVLSQLSLRDTPEGKVPDDNYKDKHKDKHKHKHKL